MICCIPWVLNVATGFQFAASSQLFSAALQIQVIFLVKLQHQSITPINVYTSYILLIVMLYCIPWVLNVVTGFQCAVPSLTFSGALADSSNISCETSAPIHIIYQCVYPLHFSNSNDLLHTMGP